MTGWSGSIRLPADALDRLTTPLREAINQTMHFGGWRTLPVTPKIWNIYSNRCRECLKKWADEYVAGPHDGSYRELSEWINRLLGHRESLIGFVLALRPFKHFIEPQAVAMMGELDISLLGVREAIREGQLPVRSVPLLSEAWLTLPIGTYGNPISECLGIDPEATSDEYEELSPSRVLASYYLNNSSLVSRVYAGLGAIWGRTVGDVLVGITCLGWILEAEDPIAAYCSLDAFRKGLCTSPDPSCREAVLKYLSDNELSLRQNRDRTRSAARQILEAVTEEQKALGLADFYKRLIEGPFRKYGWSLYSLNLGEWKSPPTLTPMREALIAQGGWLGSVAEQAIITDVRNGEAHETLFWDGVREVFDIEGVGVAARDVGGASIVADAFGRGAQAAVALWRSEEVDFNRAMPNFSDPGRLAPQRRAEAFFGSNGIAVVRANFNARAAIIICSKFSIEDVNPCFQALVSSHKLLPHVDEFSVSFDETGSLIMTVSRESLERTVTVWEFAFARFTAMPFTTFLPANLDARSRTESPRTAAKSIAWIATDDFLDAVDDAPDELDRQEYELILQRCLLIVVALEQAMAVIPEDARTRPQAVRDAVSEVAVWLSGGRGDHVQIEEILDLAPAQTIRFWWKKWGPVDRIPNVNNVPSRDPQLDERPRPREEPGDLRWRTM